MKLYKIIYLHFINYKLPRTLNNNYSLGSILGLLFTMQILSGLFLVMFYIPHTDLAFKSVSNIIRNIKGGWYVRYFHMNGASFIFMLIY